MLQHAFEEKMTLVVQTIQQLLDGITFESVSRTSTPMGEMYLFVTNAIKSVKLNMKMAELEGSCTDGVSGNADAGESRAAQEPEAVPSSGIAEDKAEIPPASAEETGRGAEQSAPFSAALPEAS